MKPWLTLMLCVSSVLAQPKRGEISENLIGKPAPRLELETISGKRFDLQLQKGTTVVLAFWATWCEPCREEIPRLIAIQQEYKNVVVIGISGEDPAIIREFLAAAHFNFPTAIDTGKQVSEAYGIDLLPRTFVIHRNGDVTKMIRGIPSERTLRNAIEATLH